MSLGTAVLTVPPPNGGQAAFAQRRANHGIGTRINFGFGYGAIWVIRAK